MVFETVKSETVYQGRVFDVRREQLRLPDGRMAQIDVVAHHGAVTLLPIDEEGQIWFVSQYRHPAGRILLELPAGVMEAGEDPVVTARREIREEIGMAAGKLQKLGSFFLAPGYSTEYMHVFLATGLQPDPLQADDDELLNIEKMPVELALRQAETSQIQDAKTLAALLLARPHLASLGLAPDTEIGQ